MTEDPSSIAKLQEHPDFALAVPTPDHFLPLLYTAGLAAANGGRVRRSLQAYCHGSPLPSSTIPPLALCPTTSEQKVCKLPRLQTSECPNDTGGQPADP